MSRLAPVCSNCGGTEFVWANDLKTGGFGGGSLSLRSRGELSLGTRICRSCGHADLFLKDPSILRMPHTWRPGEFTPITHHPSTPVHHPGAAPPATAPAPAPAPAPAAPPAPTPQHPPPPPPPPAVPSPAAPAAAPAPAAPPPPPPAESPPPPPEKPSEAPPAAAPSPAVGAKKPTRRRPKGKSGSSS